MIKGKKNRIIWPIMTLVILTQFSFAGTQFVNAQDTTAPDAPPFTDVVEGGRYYAPIKYLKDNGLITGYEDGSFQPLKEINRAEALKMLQLAVKTADDTATTETVPADSSTAKFNFSDVAEDVWYYPFVLSAWNNGIAKGYPDGFFHPEQTINTAESLKIVLEHEGKPIPSGVTDRPYSDVSPEDWFAPYAQVAKERTLIVESRNGGNLYPGKNMNRGDFAELIYHLIQTSKDHMFSRATWYADSLAMQSTANRELYIPTNLTAAHKTLPFNTTVRVTNIANGKSVDVRINDRGPYSTGVDLDLSRSAFETIASAGAGIINVEYSIVKTATGSTPETTDPNLIEYGF
jgi:rare lipoprotein A (peptidoglycan hydrolase)